MSEKPQPNPQSSTPTPKSSSSAARQVPLLLEMIFSISRLVVIFIGLFTTGISYYSGATLVWAIIRGAVAMLSVGFLLWLIGWQIARNALEGTRQELLQVLKADHNTKAASTPISTVETEA